MMNKSESEQLKGKKIAIVATDGFEESELLKPKMALEEAGAAVEVISAKDGGIKGWDKKDWGKKVDVDKTFHEAASQDYDGLLLPGGVINADSLRINQDAVAFISDFAAGGKPIAVICHGAWSLIEAGLVKGHTLTSWPSLKTDLENAGATWVDQEVVTDNGWVSSRKPDDIPAFNKKMIEEFAEGRHTPTSLMADQAESAGLYNH